MAWWAPTLLFRSLKRLTLLTSCAIFVLIALAPVFFAFGTSLYQNGAFTLQNYQFVLAEPRQFSLLRTSLSVAAGTSFFSLILGVPLAHFIHRTDIYLKRIIRYLYLVPLIIPSHIHAVAWIFLLGRAGMANQLAQAAFGQSFFGIYSVPGAIWVMTLSHFPIITLFVLAGLDTLDQRLEEAGLLTRTRFAVLSRITLPLIMPNIIAGAIIVFLFGLSNYGVPSLLRINTYPVEIFAQFSAFYDPGKAVALCLPLVAIVIVLLVLQRWYMKGRPYLSIGGNHRPTQRITLGKWRLPVSALILFLLMVAVGFPLVTLLMQTGSLKAWGLAFKTAWPQMVTSLILAGSAATLALILNFFIAYTLEKTDWKLRGLLDILSFIPFALPGAVLGIGMIGIWNRPEMAWVYDSLAVVALICIARFSPFAVKAVESNLKQVHPHLEEAALLVNGSWFSRLRHVTAPLTRPGCAAGWIITYIFCMGELGATLLVVPPGQSTLSIRIYTLMHYGAGNLVACLCLVLVALSLIPAAATIKFGKRTAQQGENR